MDRDGAIAKPSPAHQRKLDRDKRLLFRVPLLATTIPMPNPPPLPRAKSAPCTSRRLVYAKEPEEDEQKDIS